jgi:hypothetical protein
MKIKDATFAHAIRLPNKKMEAFIAAEKHNVELFYEPKEQVLYIGKDGVTKIVGITNIIEMTKEEEKKAKKSE